MTWCAAWLGLAIGLAACRPTAPVAPAEPAPAPAPAADPIRPVVSLFGESLPAAPLPPEIAKKRHDELATAERAYREHPDDLDAAIWFGRRTAYVGDYHGAIDIYTAALQSHPDNARLLRHRGHRYLTVRRFDEALIDLQAAASAMLAAPDRVEEDGLPNAAGVPTSTLYTNVWYHLALTHYLLGDYARAREAWQACHDAARTDDMRVAAQYWLAIVALRTGSRDEALALAARIGDDVQLHENFAYRDLLRLFADEVTADDLLGESPDDLARATYGYGIGVWHLSHGRLDAATRSFETVIATPQWAAFGYLAAEAELVATGDR